MSPFISEKTIKKNKQTGIASELRRRYVQSIFCRPYVDGTQFDLERTLRNPLEGVHLGINSEMKSNDFQHFTFETNSYRPIGGFLGQDLINFHT